MTLPDLTWYLTDIADLAARATRGAGYGLEHAGSTGRAVRWLCRQDIDGAGALAAHLANHSTGQLCPIVTGISLADQGARAEPGQLGDVAHPILLLAFVADIAQLQARAFTLTCATGLAAVAPNDMVILQGTLSGAIRLTAGGHVGKRQVLQARARVSRETARFLKHFADLTYAPSSPSSRNHGAGAVGSDND